MGSRTTRIFQPSTEKLTALIQQEMDVIMQDGRTYHGILKHISPQGLRLGTTHDNLQVKKGYFEAQLPYAEMDHIIFTSCEAW